MNTHPLRRLEDSVKHKSFLRKMNFDRRLQYHERRWIDYAVYTGPARRLLVDRRLKVSDRRHLGMLN